MSKHTNYDRARDSFRSRKVQNRSMEGRHGSASPASSQTMVADEARAVDPTIRQRRREMLTKLSDAANNDHSLLASWLFIGQDRLKAMLRGQEAISNEYAMHIEESLNLPPSWLDGKAGDNLPEDYTPGASEKDHDQTHYDPLPVAANESRTNCTTSSSSDAVGSIQAASNTESVALAEVVSMITNQKEPRETRPRVDGQTGEIRRANLQMLTAVRGSKQVLADLAQLNSSRISLMTSGRKPVSNPFATAIENALSLPKNWLDRGHEAHEVPEGVWHLLGGYPSSVNTRPPRPTPQKAQTKLISKSTAQTNPARLVTTVSHQDTAPTSVSTEAEKTSRETTQTIPESTLNTTQNSVTHSLFIKPSGELGPIAEALSRTIRHMSERDQLSEQKAFDMLGELLRESK